jgi:hypothetical protein
MYVFCPRATREDSKHRIRVHLARGGCQPTDSRAVVASVRAFADWLHDCATSAGAAF